MPDLAGPLGPKFRATTSGRKLMPSLPSTGDPWEEKDPYLLGAVRPGIFATTSGRRSMPSLPSTGDPWEEKDPYPY